MRDSFLLDISIGGVEGHTYKICSKIRQKHIIEGFIEAHGLELDIIVDLVGYLEIVGLHSKLPPLEYTHTVYDQFYNHYTVTL